MFGCEAHTVSLAPLITRLRASLQSPPPWFWLADGRLWQRLGTPNPRRLPLELLQQLHWWLIRPWLSPPRSRSLPPLPLALTWRACWLNSYRPAEVAWWWAAGLRHWREISRQRPDSLAWTVHAQRRHGWPDQCRDALALLQNKAALLASTPAPWRSPFMVFDATTPEGPSNPLPLPSWWRAALEGPGLVLKPQFGSGGRNVIRFRFTAAGLAQEGLFCPLPVVSPSPGPNADTPPRPGQLFSHWRRLCRGQNAALAVPYLVHSGTLPATDPSVVVRVITARSSPMAPIAVHLAWLEVPLGEGAVVFLNLEGRCLPRVGPPLSSSQRQALQQWRQLLNAGVPPCVGACLEAALALHALLPPLDQVAWDWIPADPQPLLLEGNGGFGLLVPRLFERLSLAPLWNP